MACPSWIWQDAANDPPTEYLLVSGPFVLVTRSAPGAVPTASTRTRTRGELLVSATVEVARRRRRSGGGAS